VLPSTILFASNLTLSNTLTALAVSHKTMGGANNSEQQRSHQSSNTPKAQPRESA
jgi:hypothetical protein